MLSILIPVYNFDVRAFVRQLHEQCLHVSEDTEILVLDDGSNVSFKEVNRELRDLEKVNYRELEKNLGRSGIRNELVRCAQHENLLILDCDGYCPDELFVQRFLDARDLAPVIYGGRIYPSGEKLKSGEMLHWKYGSRREAVKAAQRSVRPHESFMTNNFLIKKNVYDSVTMDESLTGYGHEDTLFALELKSKGIEIAHIENPLIHIGIEQASVFLNKTRQGIRNLAMLVKRGSVGESVTLVRFYQKTLRWKLGLMVRWCGRMSNPFVVRHLEGSSPNLSVFDFYKLWLLTEEMHKD